jgi:hypothetical protein
VIGPVFLCQQKDYLRLKTALFHGVSNELLNTATFFASFCAIRFLDMVALLSADFPAGDSPPGYSRAQKHV